MVPFAAGVQRTANRQNRDTKELLDDTPVAFLLEIGEHEIGVATHPIVDTIRRRAKNGATNLLG